MDEPQQPVYTVGMRADEFARRLAAAHSARFGWTAPLGELLRHLRSIGGSSERFDRIEATPSGVVIPTMPDPDQSTSHSAPRRPSAATGPPSSTVPVPASGVLSADERDHPTGQPMAEAVMARVESTIGTELPPIIVHDHAEADSLAREHDADAVTMGDEVHFREGRYRPNSPEGFALIVHEAIHVAATHEPAGEGWRDDDVDEERRALTAESTVLEQFSVPPPPALGVPAHPVSDAVARLPTSLDNSVTNAAATIPSQLAQPSATSMPHRREAQADAVMARQASVIESTAPSSARATAKAADVDRHVAAPESVDVNALRRSIIEDVKRLVRDEFERGA
jgi:hypothetical protein